MAEATAEDQRGIKLVDQFRADTTVAWMTTYSVDAAMFEQWFRPRLGNSPNNVMVLADQGRLDLALDAVGPEDAWQIGHVGSRWQLKGVTCAGSFHPKTLLTVSRTRGVELLVGSGNLKRGGWSQGHETFTRLSAADEAGRAAIAMWHSWMGRIVNQLDDDVVRDQFHAMSDELPADCLGASPVSPLIHSLDRPILEQWFERVPDSPADQLHVAAPFHDGHGAAALTQLLDALRPAELHLYLCADTKIDGDAAATAATERGAALHVWDYVDGAGEPLDFVHAKHIAATWGDDTWLLSGSANCSAAALSRTHGTPADPQARINHELVVASRHTGVPPQSLLTDVGRTEVAASSPAELRQRTFTHDTDPPLAGTDFRITTATRDSAGSVAIECKPEPPPSVWLTDGEARVEATGGTLSGALVWLVDADGMTLSNRQIVVDPAQLKRERTAANDGDRDARSGPPELRGEEGTVLVQLLAAVHAHGLFEVDVRDPARSGTADEDSADAGDTDDATATFWEHYETERIRRDPRASTYERITGRVTSDQPGIAALLNQITSVLPESAAFAALASVVPIGTFVASEPGAAEPEAAEEKESRASVVWSPTARKRVAIRNLLRRMIDGIADPHLEWVDPSAPATNAAVLVWTLAMLHACHDEVGFERAEMDALALRLCEVILERIDHVDMSALDDSVLPALTLLAWQAVQPKGIGRTRRVFEWQSTLLSLRDRGLLLLTPESGIAAAGLAGSGNARTVREVRGHLEYALTHINDDEWARRRSEALGLTVKFDTASLEGAVLLKVSGIVDPRSDLRITQLAAAVAEYRPGTKLLMHSADADADWRMSLIPGDPVHLRLADERELESASDGDAAAVFAGHRTIAAMFAAAG